MRRTRAGKPNATRPLVAVTPVLRRKTAPRRRAEEVLVGLEHLPIGQRAASAAARADGRVAVTGVGHRQDVAHGHRRDRRFVEERVERGRVALVQLLPRERGKRQHQHPARLGLRVRRGREPSTRLAASTPRAARTRANLT